LSDLPLHRKGRRDTVEEFSHAFKSQAHHCRNSYGDIFSLTVIPIMVPREPLSAGKTLRILKNKPTKNL